ncbi:MAG TPA: folylpolyglutamate synthase/dihydrofolate synthase family protein [Ktedonobacterales bacterium]
MSDGSGVRASYREPVASYADALSWIYTIGDIERSANLTRNRGDNLPRIRALLELLGNPQTAYTVSHIAGTKGKGSTSALLASIVRAAGIRTGLYTSPDLHTFRERIQVNGELISEAEVLRLLPRVREGVADLDPALGYVITYDVATVLALLYFKEVGAEHVILEVGLGGRLDATNVVQPPSLLATGISSISYDHMEVLGHTLAEIAGEKAGIIKPGVPIATGAQEGEAVAVIERIAAERGAPFARVAPAGTPGAAYTYAPGAATTEGQTFSVGTPSGEYRDLRLALLGEHQLENATLALALAQQLRAAGLSISDEAIRRGLADGRWPGRLQLVAREPYVVVDGAHNADSFARMFAALRRHFAFARLILVLGVFADKDLAGIAVEVAHAHVDLVIATTSPSYRTATPEQLAEVLHAADPWLDVRGVVNSEEAIAEALRLASPRDLVCVCGSVYLAGLALRYLATRPEVMPGVIEIQGIDH